MPWHPEGAVEPCINYFQGGFLYNFPYPMYWCICYLRGSCRKAYIWFNSALIGLLSERTMLSIIPYVIEVVPFFCPCLNSKQLIWYAFQRVSQNSTWWEHPNNFCWTVGLWFIQVARIPWISFGMWKYHLCPNLDNDDYHFWIWLFIGYSQFLHDIRLLILYFQLLSSM